ncbi:MAG TPA: calcium-binding protein [Bradyrhizobium sp.]|nr:calcium-binding protein [Bradyrhizobium sp.]
MAVTYLTETELGHFLQHSGNIEASVRSALFDSLEQSGVFQDDGGGGTRGWFEYGPFHGGAVPPTVQILDVSNSTSVQTSPNLKAIILDDNSAKLNVTGGDNDVFVAAGKGSDTINLFDSGNDTVYGGSGNDVIHGGHGDDSLVGGNGNDSIYGGSGNDTLDGGAGNDLLTSGAAAGEGSHPHVATAGNDIPATQTAGHSTLSGGAGNDTLVGAQGDVLQGGAGNDQLWLRGDASGANSTLQGGSGNDYFHIQSHTGNDTIIGGSGNDTVSFADRSFSDVTKIDVDKSTSTYTFHFSDNQTVAVSGVENLHFSDQDVTLPKP